LSGFLISGLLFTEFKKHGRINVVRFWIRRGFKIYPSFYLLMILTGVVCLAGRGSEPRISSEASATSDYARNCSAWS
ncbi:MAG TPA: hypothetical protein VNM47_12355, partial [Terriglobia bacterium]|nr:hypothetical protein [Terriglobia bacterium]